jgi:3-methylfumaryl-CoA hydratase
VSDTVPAGGGVDLAQLSQWVGRTERRTDRATPVPVAALSATLDRDDPAPKDGDPLPPLWHWLYFLPLTRRSEIGPDGHARRGGFLPPVPLPRRMWAGSRLEFHAPVRIGDAIERVSTIESVDAKQGKSGSLVFVVVRHEIAAAGAPAIREWHDIVYRDLPRPGEAAPPPKPAPVEAAWRRDVVPDDVLLFRYSALTFNGHRIHYDRRYVTSVEGYPGLVVHGPLLATLLIDLVRERRPGADVAAFAFRAVRPVFDIAPFAVCGQPAADAGGAHLWVQDRDGNLAMDATVTFR